MTQEARGYPARGRGCLMGVLGLERGGFSLSGVLPKLSEPEQRGEIFFYRFS